MNPFSRIAFACLLSLAATARAGTFTVGPQGCDSTSIQQAIDAAAILDGPDEIRVASSIEFTGQQLAIGEQDLTVVGGYADCASPAPTGYTVVRGTGSAPVVSVAGDGVRVLRNLVLRGGGGARGGAIRFHGHGVLRIEHSVLEQNSATLGGGLYVEGVAGESGTAFVELLDGTRISDNEATNGGGIFVEDDASLRLSGPDVVVARNGATETGGGIAVRNESIVEISSPGIVNLGTIVSNRARTGGGLSFYSGPDADSNLPRLSVFAEQDARPVVFFDNEASAAGGAIYAHNANSDNFQSSPRLELRDFEMRSNSAPDGAAIFLDANFTEPNDEEVAVAANLALGGVAGPCRVVPCGLVRGNTATTPDGRVILLGNGSSANIRGVTLFRNTGASIIDAFGESHSLQGARRFVFENVLLGGNTTRDHVLGFFGETALVSIARSTIEAGGDHPALRFEAQGTVRAIQNIIAHRDSAVPVVHALPAVSLDLVENLLTHDSGLALDSGNLIGPPRFNHPEFDYRLRAGSRAVDAASATESDALDLDGRLRTVDLRAKANARGARDLGAFELAEVDNLVLNDGFDSHRLIWTVPADGVPWSNFLRRSPQDAQGYSNSGSFEVDIPACASGCAVPPPAVGTNVSFLRQCIHLPGPGRYRLSGRAFIAAPASERDIPYLAWRFRRHASEDCEGAVLPGDHGFLAFAASDAERWEYTAADVLEVDDSEWGPTASIEVKLDVTRNAGDPASSGVFARFDDLRLSWAPLSSELLRDGFE